MSFTFVPCSNQPNFTFPQRRRNCESSQLDNATATLSGTLEVVNLTVGSFRTNRYNEFDFPAKQIPFTFNFGERSIDDVVAELNGEFTLEQAPVDGVLSVQTSVLAAFEGSNQNVSSGVLDDVLSVNTSLVGYVVPDGELDVTLSVETDVVGTVFCDGTLSDVLDVTTDLNGDVTFDGTFDLTLTADTVLTGVNVSSEAYLIAQLDDSLPAIHAVTFLWGNLNLVRNSVCMTNGSATMLHSLMCGTSENTDTIYISRSYTRDAATPLFDTKCLTVDQANKLYQTNSITSKHGTPLKNSVCVRTGNATPIFRTECYKRYTATRVHKRLCYTYSNAAKVNVLNCLTIEDAANIIRDRKGESFFFDSSKYTDFNTIPFFFNTMNNFDEPFEFTSPVEMIPTHQGTFKGFIPAKYCTRSGVSVDRHNLTCLTIEDAQNPLQGFCPLSPYEPPPPPPITVDTSRDTFIIPSQETYSMNITTSVFIRNTNIEIPLTDLSLSYSPSSFAWQMTANLAGGEIVNSLKPDPVTGFPVELDVTINGIKWYMFVDELSRSRSFVEKSVGIVASGLTSLLGEPYNLPESFVVDTTQTVQQIVSELLPHDWTLNWTIPDWVVPANTYSSQSTTPIQAIGEIVTQCKAMIVPSRTERVLNVVANYPVLPYNHSTTTPDFDFNEDIIESVVEVSETLSEVNGVFVHGSEPQGVIGKVVKYGTAGDVLAPTINNPFAVDTLSVRHIGEQLMATHIARPKLKQVTLPLDAVQFPLMESGSFVKITISPSDTDIPDGTHQTFDTVYGCVNSVSVNVGEVEITQTITLGDHDQSVLTTFKALIPRSKTFIGTVMGTVGSMTSVKLIGDGVITVKGTAVVGQLVYIKDNKIDGVLPALTSIPDTVIG